MSTPVLVNAVFPGDSINNVRKEGSNPDQCFLFHNLWMSSPIFESKN